ncbi:hypothetical protein EDC14_102576 [Hydrogenispora ethanolica]|uniref:Alanine-tRNA synthetase second additional domain-containing protein n=1 Tax=Hydrogenispora ethanolica TaxID=1082276 RepID=A0A4V6NGS8_HYDET|nr:alanine-tRNA synthetase second additional domain-containing protein [Hydrogenispora ethanolica]TCL62457.1 hypothetical protein EDC14_102576 [Hydrogenispora ethanolica]
MNTVNLQDLLMYAVYFAPRGQHRLIHLGHQLAQRHLNPMDRLIGVIGDAGAGKSLLIKGFFPGLELTNDDTGINVRPLPILEHAENGRFTSHTYHLDLRFEMAFTPVQRLADAVHAALAEDRRVVIEHFELLYPFLKINAGLLIGIGEEVIVTRPNLFGPLPEDIAAIVFRSLRYRKMAHTAEDLTGLVLYKELNYQGPVEHADVKHGFVLDFATQPDFDPAWVEARVCSYIEQGIPIHPLDEAHIAIGGETIGCTGPRIHLRKSSEVEHFQLLKEFKVDPATGHYLLVGLVGEDEQVNLNDLNDFFQA